MRAGLVSWSDCSRRGALGAQFLLWQALLVGRGNAALEASERAIRLDHKRYADRAWVMNMTAQPQEALVLTDKALSLGPSNPQWASRMACEAHLLLGQPEKAIPICERAVGLGFRARS